MQMNFISEGLQKQCDGGRMKKLEKLFIVLSISSSLVLMSIFCIAAWQEKQGIFKNLYVSAKEEAYDQVSAQEVQTETQIESENSAEVILPIESETTTADPYPYYIKVNRSANCVTIYIKDEDGKYTVPYKSMICSAGYATPLGKFDSKGKYKMKGLIHDVYGQYATWITGNILFHSVPSAKPTKDSVIVRNYNQLGTIASAGCIRLTVADAKWIYDNCALGTWIEIYDDAENPGPLGKPESIKLPNGSKWDPTDPDPNNPWHEKEPKIEVTKNTEIEIGEKINLLEGVKALDTCGNDISDKMEVKGFIYSDISGEYEITYQVEDVIGKTAQTTITYQVKQKEN